MKKSVVLFMFVFFIFSFCINNVAASDFLAKITGTDVSLRTGPGTNYPKVKGPRLEDGRVYEMPDDNKIKSESGCGSGYWNRIYNDNSEIGYVCSSFVAVSKKTINGEPSNACEADLKAKGFPESYWTGICLIKESHSNWNFESVITNLDWATAVSKESTCGKSYISSSSPANINTACNNVYTHTWYPASSTAVARYMDPRNFLSEEYIFQFEYLKYDNGLSGNYINGVNSILSNTDVYNYHINNNFSSLINNAGSNKNVSPIFMASRMRKELGNSNKLYGLYSGVTGGSEGYYNFYNVGVTDECATSNGATACGLDYAKRNGWYGLESALNGGAEFIASSYIDKGQYTGYLQKFNVKPNISSSLYSHQYMTNLAAPSGEGSTIYNTYSELNMLNNAFTFYIPVYQDMGNNNYFDDGAINDNTNNPSTAAISTLIISSGYKISGNYIYGIVPNTSISTLKATIESMSGSNTVSATGNNGLITTGSTITVRNATDSANFTAIINGDTSGDGQINALDLLQVQKSILGSYALSGAYNYAGDTNDDGKVNALDLLQVQKSILGSYTIMQ